MEFKKYNYNEAKQYTAHLAYQLGITYSIAKLIGDDRKIFTALADAQKINDTASYDKAWDLLQNVDGVGPKRATLYLEKYFENPYKSINWKMFELLEKFQKTTGWTNNKIYDLARRIDDASEIWNVFLTDDAITLPIAIEIYKMSTKDEPYLQNQTIEYFTQYTQLVAHQNNNNRLTVPLFNFNKELNEEYKLFLVIDNIVMLLQTAKDYRTVFNYFRENKEAELIFELTENIDTSDFGDDQVSAFEKLKTKKTMLLTGYAGTGKTYMLDKYIANMIGASVFACSLAGKAVKNFVNAMSPDSMRKVKQSTIAGLKYVSKYKDDLKDSSLVIIDEASMASLNDLASIIRLLENNQKLVLIGDINQLPAIQLDYLNWLVDDNEVELVTLDIPKRQGADSGIFKDSMAIINREIPAFNTPESQAKFGQTAIQTILKENPQADIFLTTTNQVKDVINNHKSEQVRQMPNHSVFKNKIFKQEVEFHEGYQIMIGKNNVDTGLMNGDIFVINYDGYLTDPYSGEVATDFNNKKLKIGENRDYADAGFGNKAAIIDTTAHNVQMAFAITTHKSQGSTLLKGVTIMGDGIMSNRNLLYTALTRFKESHVLYMPSVETLQNAINTSVTYEKLDDDEQQKLLDYLEKEGY